MAKKESKKVIGEKNSSVPPKRSNSHKTAEIDSLQPTPERKAKTGEKVMTLATNKLRILGKTKNPVTGEFSPTQFPPRFVKGPVVSPKLKPAKKPV